MLLHDYKNEFHFHKNISNILNRWICKTVANLLSSFRKREKKKKENILEFESKDGEYLWHALVLDLLGWVNHHWHVV